MFELSIRGDIASAHFIKGYPGPCKDLHGHTWKIEVTIVSKTLNKIGLVTDFAEMKMRLKRFLKRIDHVCLNDLPYFKKINPTTETLARYIYENFSKEVKPLKVSRVQVWESESASIVYYR